jgi:hypothetical protein
MTAVVIEHPQIYGERAVEDWRRDVYRAFQGTRHADNPLPDPVTAHDSARQGLNLIRAWVGHEARCAGAVPH